MLKSGWIDETKHLQEKYGVDNVHALDSIGYKQIIQVLDGEITREVMEEEIVIRTRQYAKRQRTWFRKENIDLEINPDDYSNEKDIIETILVRMNK
jgi:tRNA dimethylallyltransferase